MIFTCVLNSFFNTTRKIFFPLITSTPPRKRACYEIILRFLFWGARLVMRAHRVITRDEMHKLFVRKTYLEGSSSKNKFLVVRSRFHSARNDPCRPTFTCSRLHVEVGRQGLYRRYDIN